MCPKNEVNTPGSRRPSRSRDLVAMIHYPSGQIRLEVPALVEPGGEGSPYGEVGAVRFKDITGEKWENLEDIKILHYSVARSPVPIDLQDVTIRLKIKEIIDFIKQNPEIMYVMLKSGAFA